MSKALNLETIYDRNFTEIISVIKQVENGEILLEKPTVPTEIDKKNIEEHKAIETTDSEIKLPKISGEYVESFGAAHGELHIRANEADIQFYFPGPDLRYNGTFFYIPENEIDNYIKAYKDNWIKAQELYEKAQTLPDTTLRIVGEKGMNIVVSNRSINIYLHQHHLPIQTEEQCSNMINSFNIAKLRIKEIQSKLFE